MSTWKNPLPVWLGSAGTLLIALVVLTGCSTQLRHTEAPSLSLEEQRQAILSMTGSYEVTFHFEETLALQPGYALKPTYTEHATEKVYLLEDSPTRISLQHILVAGGHVVKHWRQDWEYEQSHFWHYMGDYTWGKRQVSEAEAKGRWVQTVWQVDDSPRYAGIGRWEKRHGVISWESDPSWRPLPRREHTKRKDYDVLVTVNRHVLTPDGWAHEQDSKKLRTQDDTLVAREIGINTYRRNDTLDFSKADTYWAETAAYWAQVRKLWDEQLRQASTALQWPGDDRRPHYSAMNRAALNQADNTSEAALREAAAQALQPFLISTDAARGQISNLP